MSLFENHRRRGLVGVATALAVVTLTVPFGTASEGGSPGGNAVVAGLFVDQSTGQTFLVSIEATESPPTPPSSATEAGIGSIRIRLRGSGAVPIELRGRVNLCTLFTAGEAPPFEGDDGSRPFTHGVCGRANVQSVRVDGCRLNATAHVFSHSDHPFVTFYGGAVSDVHVNARADQSGRIEIKIHTPKAPIQLAGDLEPGAAFMSTCQ